MSEKLSYEEFSKAIISNDIKAYTTFYKNNFQKFCLVANKYVKDIFVAEEIVQEIFVRLWEGEFEMMEIKSIESYITKTVINQSLNWLKKQKKISQHHEILASQNNDDFINNMLEEQELTVLIYKEIEKLPKQCQKVFKLSRFEYLKYKEIAIELNISEKTVENHISHALKVLRIKLFNENNENNSSYYKFKLYSMLIL